MIAKGSFEVTIDAEPPYDTVAGVAHSRAVFDKRFTGPLEASGSVQMLAVRSEAQPDSGAYVALERISGVLDGRRGTFSVVHTGLMHRGQRSLALTIAPGSGTGELRGIRGSMQIDIVDGRHFYTVDYDFEE